MFYLRFILLLVVQTLIIRHADSQVRNPVSIFANGGYILTLFEANTPLAAMGDGGVRVELGQGFVIFGGAHYQFFLKPTTINSELVRRYKTSIVGGNIGLLYEIPTTNEWYIGPGLAFEESFFRIHATALDFSVYTSPNYKDIPLNPVIYAGRIFVNFRKPLGKVMSFQGGISYTQLFGVYYADYVSTKNTPNDDFFNFYVGLVYRFGVPRMARARMMNKRIDFLGCPKF